MPPYWCLFVHFLHSLLVITIVNAIFAMVRKIDSEDRSHLEHSTVAILLTLKINVDDHCYSLSPMMNS